MSSLSSSNTSSTPIISNIQTDTLTFTKSGNNINSNSLGQVGSSFSHVNKLASQLNSLIENNVPIATTATNSYQLSPVQSTTTHSLSASSIILNNLNEKKSVRSSPNLTTIMNNSGCGEVFGKLRSAKFSPTENSNGIACSLVKSNTNIYYNLKVDSIASKAIHYCDQCTNPECRAIHKSLTKPLVQNQLHTQSGVTGSRIYLCPSSNTLSPSSSTQNTKGANINFIFERRYPLVQLNGNLLSAVTGTATEASRTISPSSQQQQRILIRPHHTVGTNSIASNSGEESHSTIAFPLPLSPSSSIQHAMAAAAALAAAHAHNSDPTKPATFSINFNRFSTNSTTAPSSTNSTITSASLKHTQQAQQKNILHSTNSDRSFFNNNNRNNKNSNRDLLDETLSYFPTTNINNPRYKNIMLLDQVIF